MGYYFYFWTAPPSGMAQQFAQAPLDEWLDFARAANAERPDDNPDYEPELLELAERLQGSLAPAELETEAYAVFDRLVHSIYLDTLEEFLPRQWLPPEINSDGGVWSYRWYKGAFKQLNLQNSPPELRPLLERLLTGYPFARDAAQFPYVQEYEGYLMAYWTAAEVKFIHDHWPTNLEEPRVWDVMRIALDVAHAEGAGLTILCT